jgi:hypothetical protein
MRTLLRSSWLARPSFSILYVGDSSDSRYVSKILYEGRSNKANVQLACGFSFPRLFYDAARRVRFAQDGHGKGIFGRVLREGLIPGGNNGLPGFSADEAVAAMERTTGSTDRYEYLVLDTDRTLTMQSEISTAVRDGYELAAVIGSPSSENDNVPCLSLPISSSFSKNPPGVPLHEQTPGMKDASRALISGYGSSVQLNPVDVSGYTDAVTAATR